MQQQHVDPSHTAAPLSKRDEMYARLGGLVLTGPAALPELKPMDDFVLTSNRFYVPSKERQILGEFFPSTQLVADIVNGRRSGSDVVTHSDAFKRMFFDDQRVLLDWSTDTLNHWNAAYFATENCFEEEHRPHGLFARLTIVQRALGELIRDIFPDMRSLKVKELASGPSFSLWANAAKQLGAGTCLDVTLTDLQTSTLPNFNAFPKEVSPSNLTCKIETENILHEPTPLADAQKFDLVTCFYGFDSVDYPEDRHLIKGPSGDWGELHQRVKYWPSRLMSILLDLIEEPLSLKQLSLAEQFQDLYWETVTLPIDIKSQPWSHLVEARVAHAKTARIGAPFGAARRIMRTFERQIGPDGVMVIGDVAEATSTETLVAEGASVRSPHFALSRTGAAYKILDFYLLKQILESEGYQAQIVSVLDVVEQKLAKISDHEMSEAEKKTLEYLREDSDAARGQVFMIVRRAPLAAPAIPSLE